MDEATAYIDPENEALVQQAISTLTVGKTLIVIAHRLSTIVGAGDGNPLAFTAGKMGTGAADNGIIPLIQLADKGVTATLFSACSTSASVASGLPMRIFSRMLRLAVLPWAAMN